MRDKLCKLADGLAVTDTDSYTTYSYDTGNITPKINVGNGEPLALVFSIGVAAAGSTDTTHFFLIAATSADLGTGTIKVIDRLIANALLTAGKKVVLPIPPMLAPLRYIGGRVELGSGDTITVDADICYLSDVNVADIYASGFSIS
jgi:hypothetical protein